MQLKIGDLVVHPAFGLGHIVEIEERPLSEKKTHLYYKVIRLKHSMWVRVEAQEVAGLRLATAQSDLDHYRDVLKSPPVPLNADLQQRHLGLVSRLSQGSFQGVCEVMRDLTAWGGREPLNRADTTILQKTRDSLSQEWAAAAGLSPTEAIREIASLLLAPEPAYI